MPLSEIAVFCFAFPFRQLVREQCAVRRVEIRACNARAESECRCQQFKLTIEPHRDSWQVPEERGHFLPIVTRRQGVIYDDSRQTAVCRKWLHERLHDERHTQHVEPDLEAIFSSTVPCDARVKSAVRATC
jgi:hypothetical protein